MDIKYTFRDLIVYLLTGFTSMVLFFIARPEHLKLMYDSVLIKYLMDNQFLFILVLIPILYIIGHIIQIFDLIISFDIAQKLERYKWETPYNSSRNIFIKIIQGIYALCASSTTEYQYKKRGIAHRDFNSMKYQLIVTNKYNTAEYYYLLKELFNGLRVFTLLFLLYMLFDYLWLENCTCYTVVIIYIVLFFLFWTKAYNSAKNFSYEVTKVYDANNQKDEEL